ncbi:mesoderm-specific transcript homolog protein isoform X2 [Amblyraja radiata]|uniref:mesoderm-specific transcript homolog protein isoform X2 n=1 Tax=Amblyraja radiata TaxID=386614 RepID=UPI001402A914|nr:mesoderm-specific transcript homolog protein isoform X2 [Amblyraja radiata]
MKVWWIQIALLAVPLIAVYLHLPPPILSPSLYSWRTAGAFFTFKDYRIFYRDSKGAFGSSDMVVLLHGFPTSSYDWHKIWEGLMLRFNRVIAVDFLGFGFSDKPRRHRYSIFEQADIVQGLMAELGLAQQKINILAHDYGDTVALELLYRSEHGNPGHLIINSLCLSNGVTQKQWLPFTNLHQTYQLLFFLKRNQCSVWTPHTADNCRILGHVDRCPDQRWKPRHGQYFTVHQSKVEVQRSMVHLIYGPLDSVNPHPEFLNLYQTLVPNSTVSVLDDHISHYPQLEDPVGFGQAYTNFINSF